MSNICIPLNFDMKKNVFALKLTRELMNDFNIKTDDRLYYTYENNKLCYRKKPSKNSELTFVRFSNKLRIFIEVPVLIIAQKDYELGQLFEPSIEGDTLMFNPLGSNGTPLGVEAPERKGKAKSTLALYERTDRRIREVELGALRASTARAMLQSAVYDMQLKKRK